MEMRQLSLIMQLDEILHAALGKSALIVCCCIEFDALHSNSINHSESISALNPVILVAEQGGSISADVLQEQRH